MILPINTSSLHWAEIIRACSELMEDNPIKFLDANKIKPNSEAGYLALLSFMDNDSQNFRDAIKNSGRLKEHLFFGFMVHCNDFVAQKLLLKSGLRISITTTPVKDKIVIMSGNLYEWYEELVNIGLDDDLRYLVQHFYRYFDSINLSMVWADYSKVYQADETFLLERR